MNSFRELLEEYNIPIAPAGHPHNTPGWIQIDCPYCTPDSRHWRMGYNERGRFVNCWHCGSHSLAETVSLLTRLPIEQVRRLLRTVLHGPITAQDRLKGRKGTYTPPRHLSALLQAHRTYLLRRGFKNLPELIRLWQIQGLGMDAGRLRWRLFIPIVYQGRPVSWTTRSLSNEGLRYLSAKAEEEAIPHKTLLYGMDYVRTTAIINEGPLDVWAIGPGAVCTFGTAFTPQQLVKIGSIPRRVICYDGTEEAQKRARNLYHQLAGFPGETINVVLDAKDAAECSPLELHKLRKLLT